MYVSSNVQYGIFTREWALQVPPVKSYDNVASVKVETQSLVSLFVFFLLFKLKEQLIYIIVLLFFTSPLSDLEVPTVLCPSDVMQSTDLNLMTTNVTWSPPSAVDNSGQIASLVSDVQPGLFRIGVTVVTYVATDPSENEGNCSFTVTVYGKCCKEYFWFRSVLLWILWVFSLAAHRF